MAIVANEFHATLKQQERFVATIKKPEPKHVEVKSILIQSNNAYKGDFATMQDLRQVLAFSGDYADVFETNTRWAFIDGQWKDTKQEILINPTLATKQDVGVLEERVASLETAIENPTLLITKI
jgi:hypothetical protein